MSPLLVLCMYWGTVYVFPPPTIIGLNYIFQPYTERCEIKFVEDLFDDIPAYKLTMRPTDAEQMQRFNSAVTTNSYRSKQI